ncbi:hypothetical protein Lal_00025184 [Lupinus albus]|nr:hypothetical protein Lal_00025184 [Lupinus albus]
MNLINIVFGFSDEFTCWINSILNSAKLSININDRNVGFFNCKRDVIQGDPLFPLLFCFEDDVLCRSISNLVDNGKIRIITSPKNLITYRHVLYVDD